MTKILEFPKPCVILGLFCVIPRLDWGISNSGNFRLFASRNSRFYLKFLESFCVYIHLKAPRNSKIPKQIPPKSAIIPANQRQIMSKKDDIVIHAQSLNIYLAAFLAGLLAVVGWLSVSYTSISLELQLLGICAIVVLIVAIIVVQISLNKARKEIRRLKWVWYP